MKTLERSTTLVTPVTQTRNDGLGHLGSPELLDLLRSRVRHLWALEPDAHGYEREGLITSLSALDVSLERLAYRPQHDRLNPDDEAEMERCQEHLLELELRWRSC